MESSIRLGRVAGIPIGINWSWLAVFALVVWSLGSGVFPDQHPGLSGGTHYAMAVAAAVLFFASVLLHELGHAIRARREGMPIDGITLWLFGGVARFRGMFPSAGAEFRIAIAGPVVTLVIGIACLGLAQAPLPEPVEGVAFWLGYIQGILLVFNLLPALPLDGGRVLRAGLWHRRGDFSWATRVAGHAGRAFAVLFIAGGLLLVFAGGLFSGVWLAFIGWFLLGAVDAEVGLASARQALGDLLVRDLMSPRPVTVPADASIGALVDDVIRAHRYTTYPAVEAGGRVVGLVPFRCIAEVPREGWDDRPVRACAIALDEIVVLAPDDPAAEALERLREGDLGRAVVMEGGRLVGLLSITDLARAMRLRPPEPRRAGPLGGRRPVPD